MDLSSRSEDILELGKQLVYQLGLSKSLDTLGRWLAHTLAEKLLAAENAPAAEKPACQAEAIDLILKLWAHRRDFPRGARPFEDLEGLAMALAQLDPNDKTPRFFSPASPREVAGAAPEAKPWLDRALAIDAAARAAIRYCLLAADEATPGDSTKWAELAETAGLECDVEVLLVRFVGRLSEQQRKDLDSEVASSQRHVRARVASLKEAASAIEADLARKLRAAAEGVQSRIVWYTGFRTRSGRTDHARGLIEARASGSIDDTPSGMAAGSDPVRFSGADCSWVGPSAASGDSIDQQPSTD